MITSSFVTDILILMTLGVMVCHGLFLRKRGRWMLIDPLNAFWAGCLACYVIQPATHYKYYLDWYTPDLITQAQMWIIFGMVFVAFGYESKLGQHWGRKLPSLPPRLSPTRLTLAGIAAIGIGLIGYAILIRSAGSLSAWLSVGRGGTDYSQVSGYASQLEAFLPAGITILLLHVEIHRDRGIKRLLTWCMAVVMLLWLVYLGTRSRTANFIGTMIAAYYFLRRKNPPFKLMIPVGACLFVLVNFLAIYRGTFNNFSFNLDKLDWSDVAARVIPGMDNSQIAKAGPTPGEEFSCVVATVNVVPSRANFNYGTVFLEYFTHAIPRAWWPNKYYPMLESIHPVMLEGGLSHNYIETGHGSFLVGPALTFVGFYYAVGGPIALVIFGYLTGAFLRMIRTMYDRDPMNEGNMVFYLYLVSLGFGEAAATPTSWVFAAPIVLLPLGIALYLCRARTFNIGGQNIGAFPVLTQTDSNAILTQRSVV